GAAFAVALPANALRIALAVKLYEMDSLYGPVVTPGRVHRAMGCAIYLTALLLSFLALERALRRPTSSFFVPSAWYLAIVLGLPDVSGIELCKEIRKTHATPIIFLPARTAEIDRVVGLEIGADDYVTKPFSPKELAARVKAVLRRTRGASEAAPPPSPSPHGS